MADGNPVHGLRVLHALGAGGRFMPGAGGWTVTEQALRDAQKRGLRELELQRPGEPGAHLVRVTDALAHYERQRAA